MDNLLAAIPRERVASICRRYGVERLAVFGSATSGSPRPDSDIDVLVEFRPGHHVGLRFITLQDELTSLLGRPVDLNTPAFLSPHFRDRVRAEAVPLYDTA